MPRKRRLSTHDVWEILDSYFHRNVHLNEIKRQWEEKASATLIYRICLPQGHKDARYNRVRERFFRGEKPLFAKQEAIVDKLLKHVAENTKTPEREFSGKKYEREIHSISGVHSVVVDVYCVLEAFKVECPAVQHAIKKLLCAGLRGKGDVTQDLNEAIDALTRAVQLNGTRNKASSD